jgi:hypothetical protein
MVEECQRKAITEQVGTAFEDKRKGRMRKRNN